jgi:hypothetical protein
MNRNILLVVWMFSLASICYAQTPEHLWSVADYCAAATQDAKDNVPTAQAEAKCKYPPEFTKRCIDKPREMSRISNHTRDAVCAARTAREAKAILVNGSVEVNNIAQEEAKFWRLQAYKARVIADQVNKQIEDQNAFCNANHIKVYNQTPIYTHTPVFTETWIFTDECTGAYVRSGKSLSDLYLPANPSLKR